MIQIRLLGNTVHLWPLKPSLRSEAGIHLIEGYQDDRTQYRVLGVGPGKRQKDGAVRPVEARPGQFCLVPFLQDSHTLSDGSIICKADQIAAVWDNEIETPIQTPDPGTGAAAPGPGVAN